MSPPSPTLASDDELCNPAGGGKGCSSELNSIAPFALFALVLSLFRFFIYRRSESSEVKKLGHIQQVFTDSSFLEPSSGDWQLGPISLWVLAFGSPGSRTGEQPKWLFPRTIMMGLAALGTRGNTRAMLAETIPPLAQPSAQSLLRECQFLLYSLAFSSASFPPNQMSRSCV